MVRQRGLLHFISAAASSPSSSTGGSIKSSTNSSSSSKSWHSNRSNTCCNKKNNASVIGSGIRSTAQQIVFQLFLLQSAAFFLFHVVVMTADDAAASPTYSYNSYYDSNVNGNSNSNNNNNNDSHQLSAFYRHYYSYQQHQHPFERSNLFLRNRAASFLRTSFDDVSVYREFTACSNDVLTLSCPTPDSTVFLLSLYPLPNNDEAIRDPNACVAPSVSASPTASPYSTSSPVDLSCQYFKNNVQTIRSRCKTTSSCTVRVGDLFDYSSPVQRSCTVIATFQCHPSPKMKNLPQYLRFCTNDVMRLTCPEKQDWLVITTAVYDFRPPSGDKTCSNVKRNVYCYAPQTQTVIRSHCERKRSCKLFINETTFGPIYGRSSLAAAQPSSNSRPITTAPSVISGSGIDADATAQCPTADNFALYVYFMCVPKIILSPHPRSSLSASGSPSGSGSKQQPGNIRSSLLETTPIAVSSSTEEEELTSREQLLLSPSSAQSNNNRGVTVAISGSSPTKSPSSSNKAQLSTPSVAGSALSSPPSQQRRTSTTLRSSPTSAAPTSSPPSPTQVVSSSVIDQPSSVFRLFSDWIFALDYIQRNPYPVIATASLGVCIGLLLGAAVLLVRLSCRLRAARYHPPRRSVGLQCEMFAGRPAVLVRSTASQTANTSSTRPSSGVQEPPQSQPPPPQQTVSVQQQPVVQAQQQRYIAASTTITSNGHHHPGQHPQQQQQTMQAMAAMCAQTTIAPPSGVLNPSLYAGPPAATAIAASRPLLMSQQQQQQSNQQYQSQQQQPLLPQQQPSTMTSSLGSSSIGSQAGAGALQNAGPNRNYTYTPRLSVRWFQ